ncbi:MAG: purine-nucleoside phosphorylase [Sphaerochaetaceae bacterium]
MEQLNVASEFVLSSIGEPLPAIAIILGSGLGALADELEEKIILPYKEIPNFPHSSVKGHAGRLVAGYLEGRRLLVMQGRSHYYEGYSLRQIAFPVQMMATMGIKELLVTNAAGCVNPAWSAGDLMLINDHIKLIGDSPLRGENLESLGERFFDMSRAYPVALRQIARQAANELDIELREGVYQFFGGPNFETPSEVRFARLCGADAVGMSTVSEVIAANHAGMRVMGISCLTNMAAGILETPLTHQEVLETGERVKQTFSQLVRSIVRKWEVE